MRTYLTAGQIKSALANTPQITFEVTDACNLRCKYGTCGQLYAGYDVHAAQVPFLCNMQTINKLQLYDKKTAKTLDKRKNNAYYCIVKPLFERMRS